MGLSYLSLWKCNVIIYLWSLVAVIRDWVAAQSSYDVDYFELLEMSQII